MKNDPHLESLSLHFETLLIRVEAGQSLRQALQDAPEIKCSKKWIQRWQPLRNRLLQGQSQTLQGLRSYRNAIILEQKLGRLVRKKAFMPLFQAISVFLTSLMLVIFTQFFGEGIFEFTAIDYAVEFFFFFCGSLWIYFLMKNLFKDLWLLDWIDFLSSLESQMSWGQNLLTSWKSTLDDPKQFPKKLQTLLEHSYIQAQKYEVLSPHILKETLPKSHLEKRCWERWKQVHNLFVKNDSVRLLLSTEAESSYTRLEEHLEIKSEKLSGLLMLPLFLCFLPASLYVVLIPLLRIFN